MSAKRRPYHRYLVIDVGPGGERAGLALGSVLIHTWVGHSHQFMTEKGGVVEYMCSVNWAGRYKAPEGVS